MTTPTQAPQADPGTHTLKVPVSHEKQEITEVTLRRIKGKDLIAAEREMRARGVKDAGEMERTLYLLARSLGVAFEVVEEFDSGDITALSQKAQELGFF